MKFIAVKTQNAENAAKEWESVHIIVEGKLQVMMTKICRCRVGKW